MSIQGKLEIIKNFITFASRSQNWNRINWYNSDTNDPFADSDSDEEKYICTVSRVLK